MKIVLVFGLGETSGPIFSVLKESKKFNVYGVDLDKIKMDESGAVLHK